MTDRNRKSGDIRERSFQYATRAIALYRFLRKTRDDVGITIGKQYLQSAMAIGANVEDAHSTNRRADTLQKYVNARQSARQSLYWLKLLAASEIVPPQRLNSLLQETEGLISVFSTVLKRMKLQNRSVQN
jgi:four helix bundle protein